MRIPFAAVLFLLATSAVFLELGRMDVYTDNEGQRLTPPYEMLVSGDYAVPTLNGGVYLAKPPLLYWAIAAVYRATGVVNEWTGRFVPAACAVLVVLAIYFVTRSAVDETIARFAAIGTLAAPYILERARWADIDIPLTLAVFLAIAALRASWHAPWAGRRAGMALIAGLMTGAAILLKGPVPLIVLAAALVAEIIASGKNPSRAVRQGLVWTAVCVAIECLRMLAGFDAPVALVLLAIGWAGVAIAHAGRGALLRGTTWVGVLALGAVVALPWGLVVLYRMGDASIATLLQEQVVERTYRASRINGGTPFYFALAMPIMLFPWGLLLPWHASGLMWRLGDSFYRFCLLTGWISIFTFSLIAGKEYEYILPALPFVMITTAYHLAWAVSHAAMPDWFSRWFQRWRIATVAIVLLAVLVPLPYVMLCLGSLTPTVEVGALTAAIVALLAARFRARRTEIVAIGAAATLAAVSMLLVTRSYHYGPERSPRAMATLCRALIAEGHTVESTKTYPPVAWYARRPIPENTNPDVVAARLDAGPPYFYLTRSRFPALVHTDAPWENYIVAGPIPYRDLVLLANESGKAYFETRFRSVSPE